MVAAEVRFDLEGDEGAIGAESAARALEALSQLTRGATGREWVVSSLETGSVHLGLRPRGASEAESLSVIRGIAADLDRLRECKEVPRGWSKAAVEAVFALHRVAFDAGVTSTSLSFADAQVEIDAEIAQVAKQLTRSRTHSFGSVKGVVDRLALRSRRTFGLVDEKTEEPVTVSFEASDLEKVRRAVNRRVLVWGLVARDIDGNKRELQLRDIVFLDDTTEEPIPFEAGLGALGEDWTGGLSSVDWIREQHRA